MKFNASLGSTKARNLKHEQTNASVYNFSCLCSGSSPLHLSTPTTTSNTSLFAMAPKPASTAGKAPASTASKAPAKSTEGAKAAKKTSKAAAPADGEKKKRKKVRKETYSSYIYKGM